jgi:bifunctional dethiobiotin synthetase / adenosylmethionine---8-amino-7-oxononanoate aminotransferase
VKTKTLWQFREPVSPHIAAKLDGRIPANAEIVQETYSALHRAAKARADVAFVETAGGVLSPGPSGDAQADIFRALRLPALLVGDHRLGGVATTMSAYESLKLRGYDVAGLLLFGEGRFGNGEYLVGKLGESGVQSVVLEAPPDRLEDVGRDEAGMMAYYDSVTRNPGLVAFLEEVFRKQEDRGEKLRDMGRRANEVIWYPFTQHKLLKEKDIMVVDSAYNDHFDTLAPSSTGEDSILKPSFDASASWWTQGVGHSNPQLALAAAYAAGRYGHVMFAQAISEPALALAEALIQHHRNSRLRKVFYSDNGSTGMEVAIKMALRASCERYGWDHKSNDIEILGFKGSYHGDTMGVMDSSEPSTYNDKVEWYRPRGGMLSD